MDLVSEIDIFYDCDECDETFDTDSEMQNHKNKVHEKHYACQICICQFKEASDLDHHVMCEHMEGTVFPYSCDLCKRMFPRKCLLNDHMHIAHASQKTHTCEVCQKTFFTKVGVKHHNNMVHKKKQWYSCPDCSQTFRSEKALEMHIDRKHLNIGGKKFVSYKCDECGKTLAAGCLFHVCKNEVPLTCEECGEGFTSSVDFKDHKKSFHGPIKHSCTECEKMYSNREKLVSHYKRTHADKYLEMMALEMQENDRITSSPDNNLISGNTKKHKCDFCEIAFVRPENLKRHIQRMHKKQKGTCE